MQRVLMLLLALVLSAGIANAAPPGIISYQGRLTDAAGNPVPDGQYSVTFGLYLGEYLATPTWQETQQVTTKDGLFSVGLGSITPIDPWIIKDLDIYLGIKVGSDPVMYPRTQLASAPFSLISQTVRQNFGSHLRIWMGSNDAKSAELSLRDSTGDRAITIRQDSTFNNVVVCQPGTGAQRITLATYPTYSLLRLSDNAGLQKVGFYPDETGDAAARVPDSSISAIEMQNEPGLAANDNAATVVLMASMTDVVTTSLNAPTSGYVLVVGKATAFLSGNMGVNYGYLQIDTAAGGNAEAPYRTVFGSEMMWTGAVSCFPVTVTRVFQVSAGSHTFRLEGRHSGLQGTGNVVDIRNAMIQAVFIPTGYGTVNTLVSAGGATQFEQKEAVQVDGETMYRVDLRELEVKAARAEAEANRLKLQLLEAKLQQVEE